MFISCEDIVVEIVWEEWIGFIGGLEFDDDDDDDFDFLDNLLLMFGVLILLWGFIDLEWEEFWELNFVEGSFDVDGKLVWFLYV